MRHQPVPSPAACHNPRGSARLPERAGTPNACLTGPLAERIRSRQRISASRDRNRAAAAGSAAPFQNASIVTATDGKLLAFAAASDAAPSVGPTQGLHTAPSNRPTPNWPIHPSVENRRTCFSVQATDRAGSQGKAAWKAGTSRTAPMITSRIAAVVRKRLASRPRQIRPWRQECRLL